MEPQRTMDSGRNPCNKITEIVRLRQMLKKWKKLAAAPKSNGAKKGIGFLKRTLSFTDASSAAAASAASGGGDVPKGFLAVCVGEEMRRFVIPTEHLSHRAFVALLQEAEEEFGFQHEGVLRIPCEVSVFESILAVVEDKKKEACCYCSSEAEVFFFFSCSWGEMSGAMKKVEKIRQVVKLKQVMRRWRALSLSRFHRTGSVGDVGGGGGSGGGRPVPPGTLAVYVGAERRRFVIPTRFLGFPVFAALLKQAEEEFGFSSAGGLVLPCCAELFRRVLEMLDMDEDRFKEMPLEGFVTLGGVGGAESFDFSCCRDELGAAEAGSYNGFSPLLQNARV
ncbi:hypothetical protein Taro_036395 [Colocasia esculenta]|uniref:Uncharacterized protein n=1 Tax=Colocasia esculenta TaxID=4460 RepID=A0A843WG73_COLES|nr:hypothetical protein [Colocasia esculenta]